MNIEATAQFLTALTGNLATPVVFQTFPDNKDIAHKFQAQVLWGSLSQHLKRLVELNEDGHGIFVTVNASNGSRKATDITALRACFVDDDSNSLPPGDPRLKGCPPSMSVKSAHGHHHYWLLKPDQPLTSFTPTQVALATILKTDTKIKDLPRVMRIPGFVHHKGEPTAVSIVVPDSGVRYDIGILSLAYRVEPTIKPIEQLRPRANVTGGLSNVERATRYANVVEGAVQGDGGDQKTYTLATALVRGFDLTVDEALEAMEDWNQTCDPPWSEQDLRAKIENGLKNGTEEIGGRLNRPKPTKPEVQKDAGIPITQMTADTVEGMKEKMAMKLDVCTEIAYIVPLEKYAYKTPQGRWNTDRLVSRPAIAQYLSSTGVTGIKARLDYKRHIIALGLDCAPSKPETFEDEGVTYINTYVPSTYRPTPGKWDTIRLLMSTITEKDPKAFGWLFNWMAAKVQHPEIRAMTAPVFQGKPGNGKTAVGLFLGYILGEENTASITQEDIDSSFNGHYVNKLLIQADEVVNADNIRDTSSKLKKMITDPRLQRNGKNQGQIQITNRMAWWFTSNDTTPVKVEEGDRRYSVFCCPDEPSEDYKKIAKAMWSESHGPTEATKREIEAFAADLLAHTVDRALATSVYRNASRDTLIENSRSSAQDFLEEIDAVGFDLLWKRYHTNAQVVPTAITLSHLYTLYAFHAKDAGNTMLSKKKTFSAAIKSHRPTWVRARQPTGERLEVFSGIPCNPKE